MPQQVTGVLIADNDDGTCDVQVGPNGYGGLPVSQFFDRSTFNQDQLVGNIRLTRVIGNYGALGSRELADRLNAHGVRLSDGDYAGLSLTDNGDGSVTVAFANQTITVPSGQFEGDTGDQQLLLWNLASFLRLAGFTDLTTPAPGGPLAGTTGAEAVAGATFWY